ncbi:MAG: RpiB/LacA/LacB family sugar-phosphate isomerase [Saprospiraceae bacterium]|nr:RpiB/LacA/LacB family sugar-phosphate isomerase [Saprospiraceae bacterium]
MSTTRTISIGCDHAGYVYKDRIVQLLKDEGCIVVDHGTNSEASTDYPDHIHPVGTDLDTGSSDLGIILCGSGNGAAMTANKHQSVRAAVCWNVELASLAREHNNANVLSIPARFVNEATALAMVKTFIDTPFEGGRHARRVGKIALSKAVQDC